MQNQTRPNPSEVKPQTPEEKAKAAKLQADKDANPDANKSGNAR